MKCLTKFRQYVQERGVADIETLNVLQQMETTVLYWSILLKKLYWHILHEFETSRPQIIRKSDNQNPTRGNFRENNKICHS